MGHHLDELSRDVIAGYVGIYAFSLTEDPLWLEQPSSKPRPDDVTVHPFILHLEILTMEESCAKRIIAE
ncbi:hypothetical protein [Oryza sativa Japonica Group]|uniref:Uncharacterized protein n=1 Tax=Oryza sativa subsp. japonica TaxID=39947 RepID=Q5JMX6_ORYSJ|nr:hypothetical protein [Oryza sativa Japonica Group]BAD87182.1 hypothetical protein [Oryza sativa Japonica Group]